MELLRNVVVLLHLVGFAVTFGAWVAEAAARRFRFTPVMNYGILISFLTGVALAAPWPEPAAAYDDVQDVGAVAWPK